MRKWLVLALLLGLLVSPAGAGAQGGTKLESINIELWSEFDQPSMLVISEFVVTQDTTLPAKVTMRFPKEGNLIAVAFEQNGGLFTTEFEGPVEQGNWQSVTLIVKSFDAHRIEYYQPLTREEDRRLFNFQWFGDYYVKEFTVNSIIPADSINVITSPELLNMKTSANGLNLLGKLTLSEMKMGKSFEFKLEYERTSSALTDPQQADQVQASEPIGPKTPGRVSVDRLPWIIGGIGLALIAVALFTYWRSTQANESTRSGSRRRRQHKEDGEQAYCHECGARASAGDRFCRTCGSRLRVE